MANGQARAFGPKDEVLRNHAADRSTRHFGLLKICRGQTVRSRPNDCDPKQG